MNWQAQKNRRLVSDAGYCVAPTAINGRALYIAISSTNKVLGMPRKRKDAIALCESHYQDQGNPDGST